MLKRSSKSWFSSFEFKIEDRNMEDSSFGEPTRGVRIGEMFVAVRLSLAAPKSPV